MSEFTEYGIEYRHCESSWVLSVMATSEQDARDRIQAAYYNGTVLGKSMGKIPARVPGAGLMTRLRCWLGNIFQEASHEPKP